MFEIGSFPYLIKKGKMYIMLITNKSGKLWILPKGQPEAELKDEQVAELETIEEAGVKGKVLHKSFHSDFKSETGRLLIVYPIYIDKILDKWAESSIRKRRLVEVKEALKLVTRTEHRKAIKYFSSDKNYKQMRSF